MYINYLLKSFKINSAHRPFGQLTIHGYFFNKLANFFIAFFIILKIRPNHVTYLNFLLSLMCIYVAIDSIDSNFNLIFTFYIFFLILDHCDGGIARILKIKTFFGKYLDGLVDLFFLNIFYCILTIKYFYIYSDIYILVIGLIANIFLCYDIFILDRYSAIVRWCNKENKTNLKSYIRKNLLFKFNIIIQDVIFFSILFLFVVGFNNSQIRSLMILIFSCVILSSIINLILHTFVAQKNLNFRKK